jgi:hypothetical protein
MAVQYGIEFRAETRTENAPPIAVRGQNATRLLAVATMVDQKRRCHCDISVPVDPCGSVNNTEYRDIPHAYVCEISRKLAI